MKVIDTEVTTDTREPVAALVPDCEGGVALVLRFGETDDCIKIYDDNSGGAHYSWKEETTQNTVLKFYYPGDKITIEV